jgi:hypothetical protein
MASVTGHATFFPCLRRVKLTLIASRLAAIDRNYIEICVVVQYMGQSQREIANLAIFHNSLPNRECINNIVL